MKDALLQLLLLPLLFLLILECVDGNAVPRSGNHQGEMDNEGASRLPPFLQRLRSYEREPRRDDASLQHEQQQEQQEPHRHVRSPLPSASVCHKMSFFFSNKNHQQHTLTNLLASRWVYFQVLPLLPLILEPALPTKDHG